MEKLTFQEEEIMLIIWQVKEGVIKDFLNCMEEPRPPYTTVASIVKNLEKKGYVQAKRYTKRNFFPASCRIISRIHIKRW